MAEPVKHELHIGLGEAIRRLIRVEMAYSRGITPGAELIEESKLIVAACDREFALNLGFDCKDDDVPQSVEIFKQSATTACCRLADAPGQKKVRGSSRESIFTPSTPAAPEATTSPNLRKRFISRLMGDEKE